MSDEIENLKRRLDMAEWRAETWRSRTMGLFATFVVVGAASFLWLRTTLVQRMERLEAGPPATWRVVEAEAFVVKDGSGKEIARLGNLRGLGGGLALHDLKDSYRSSVESNGFWVMDARPEKQEKRVIDGREEVLSNIYAALSASDDGTANLFLFPRTPPEGRAWPYRVNVNPDGTREIR